MKLKLDVFNATRKLKRPTFEHDLESKFSGLKFCIPFLLIKSWEFGWSIKTMFHRRWFCWIWILFCHYLHLSTCTWLTIDSVSDFLVCFSFSVSETNNLPPFFPLRYMGIWPPSFDVFKLINDVLTKYCRPSRKKKQWELSTRA